MDYGKLENSVITYAPDVLNANGQMIFSPSEYHYLSNGWKKLDFSYPIEEPPENYHYEEDGYVEMVFEIKKNWKIVKNQKVYRSFSKLKLETELLKRKLLEKFDKFLDETLIDGTSYNLRKFYSLANILSEDNDMYSAYIQMCQNYLGITSEEVEEILNLSVG